MMSGRLVTFEELDDVGFEELCFELLGEMGFVNRDWRKGTPKNASPADSGRDIVAELERVDVDGSVRLERWFVDCKHYKKGVPPTQLDNLLAWAEAESPDVALFMVSGFLSNPAKDYLTTYEANRRPRFRIKRWERPLLGQLVVERRALLQRYLLGGQRNQSEIVGAEEEFFDRIWHERHLVAINRAEESGEDTTKGVWIAAKEAADRIKARHGEGNLGPYEDFQWGMLNGKLSALRWVLGDEWDFLDT